MDLRCDQYTTCRSLTRDQGEWRKTEARARAAGWHIFHGFDQAGRALDVVLCRRCMRLNRELPPAPPTLDGQLELFGDS